MNMHLSSAAGWHTEIMHPELPSWAAELAWVSDGDEFLPSEMTGINVVLNRMRLARYMEQFGDDNDIRDFLVLDVVANAAGLPFTSTGLAESLPALALRPFRIWEYTWLYKILGLSGGGKEVLDLGGPATHLSILAALAGCRLTSLDINPEFVRAAQKCASALRLPNLVSRVGDMRDLSGFAAESFDIVVSCSVLEHLTAHDQEIALAEVARVLKPGGLVGLTFDYGPAASGANVYLPPPHDPPATAAEVVRRYAREGLVVVGNPFSEEAVAGVLFRDDIVRYTVASLFLAKPPVPEIRPPQPKTTGSALKDLVLTMLPSRIRRRTLAAQASSVPLDRAIAVRDERIAELERMADERLHALNVMDVSVNALRHEAEKRECGLHELAAIIAARDARIAELEEVAGRRLDALNAMDVSFSTLQYEADERERGLHELTAIIAGRDARIAELEQTTEDRLAALNAMGVSFSALQYEANERERGLHELTAIIAGRDARIAELAREIERHVAERDTMTRRLVVLESETLLRYALRRMGRSEDR